ncbi:Uncharacterized protein DBV15_06540 [Temnothorax longispinosus]|uniref:Uncharacterized protein n=1 Tax=Temnothorax longispinosus TaxID=300112 RepID=A0A4S2KBM3_9HYME|nr:Uncharacterized protein DBV15_06540 [Temnothorax longispinosus]
MACYFGWIVIDLRIIFSAMLINNYIKTNRYICAVLHFVWLTHNVLKFLLINYVCETVSAKKLFQFSTYSNFRQVQQEIY